MSEEPGSIVNKSNQKGLAPLAISLFDGCIFRPNLNTDSGSI